MRLLTLLIALCGWQLGCSSREVIGTSYEPGDAGAGGTGMAGTAGTTPVQAGSAGTGGGGGQGTDTLEPTYDEPWRGQFHFSLPGMWLGPIDALWFDAGTYHLTYQVDPFAFVQGQDERWGHATSTDLLHWQHHGLVLAPGVNVTGEAWVGSVVVDTNDTAGFKTGDHPAYVAVFTDTGAGTSLAYSNDFGQTWQAYEDNPVGIGDGDYMTNRDPLVLWHEPTKQWVCAYWQDGITFYTSPDLKQWTKRGHVSWGTLVPDLYELPLDGNDEDRRWVLHDGQGKYLVGDFDGETFVQSAGPFPLDYGPNLPSARTGFRATFPGGRAVQVGWLTSAGHPTAPARGDLSFPVELGLSTFPEGIRLTRTPIAEISELYGNTRHFEAHTLATGQNLLAGIEAKAFDLELELDAAALPGAIRLQIADQIVLYDGVKQTLLGQPLAPLDDVLRLRVLADHGQLEIFGNGGELSYSASLPFDPDDASLSLTADGPLAISSADFREVGRIWPGTAATSSRLVDDTDPDVVYEGDWTAITADPTYVGETCHVSKAAGAAIELTFTGTSVAWHGLVNRDLGRANVYLDGALAAENVDLYAAQRAPVRLFARSGLSATFHTLRVEATGTRNAASTGSALVHDYFLTSVEP